jgi:predicted RNA binding protein YcfA (HicA-like mRNA interferase family)
VNRRRLLRRIESGAYANIRFSDFEDLVLSLGFRPERIRGDHFIYRHPLVVERLNIQPDHGQMKPYQVGDLARYIKMYNLKLEDDRA